MPKLTKLIFLGNLKPLHACWVSLKSLFSTLVILSLSQIFYSNIQLVILKETPSTEGNHLVQTPITKVDFKARHCLNTPIKCIFCQIYNVINKLSRRKFHHDGLQV